MITKLLVANRGEIARRVFRTARAMGMATVAVASDPDLGAPHAAEADELVRLPGSTPAETYLRIDALVAAALASGADAVHPGYGFLSEQADFARACAGAGLLFVGPSPEVIEAMGSKLAAKAAMAAAGVPVLPTVEVPPGGDLGAELERAAAGLGWPVLVKASAGGGGRGMRIVEGPGDLAEALASAGREASSAFGDGTVFLEPYVDRPRHIEVQVFGDHQGNVVHLFERECSIQRRHQKILEECPSPAVSEDLRAELGAAAVTAARTIGYVGAGTVEFLLLPDGRFAFLEVNTRLQVEHPVTELVTGLDLVRLQLEVAQGLPLPAEALEPTRTGHAIEVRLYAEDPTRSWQPSAGTLHRFQVPEGVSLTTTVRVDSGVEDGSEISVFYDPMLAKVIAHAPTRSEAARVLGRALAGALVHGVTTNRDLLVAILGEPEFLAGEIDTGYLVRHDPAELGRPRADAGAVRRQALAAALAGQAARRSEAGVWAGLPSGWRNNPSQLQETTFEGPHGPVAVGYRFDRTGGVAVVAVDGEDRPDLLVGEVTPDEVVLEAGGVRRRYRVSRQGDRAFVDSPEGSSTLVEADRFPLPGSQLAAGALVAPLPGTVVRVALSPGDRVEVGQTVVAIEAMKMEHDVRATEGGQVVEVQVSVGDQVEAGRLLVLVEADGPGEEP